jgi:hypothetical protein
MARLTGAAEVLENVRNCAQIPQNEAQARPLTTLTPEVQRGPGVGPGISGTRVAGGVLFLQLHERIHKACSVAKLLKRSKESMSWAEILAAYPFLKPILDTLSPVIGDAYHLVLSGIWAKQKARELLMITEAMVEIQGSAPHASLSYQEGKWSITMPGQSPSGLMLPPASGMQLRLDQRRYDALGGALAEAAMELKNETSFPEKRPGEDWVTRYIESASQVTDQRMQELWGRILAGEIRKPGAFSLRTLHVVSNLASYEAKYFEAFAKCVVPVEVVWLCSHSSK